MMVISTATFYCSRWIKTMYYLHFLILCGLKGTNQLSTVHHKISPETDKTQPFSLDLYPYWVLLGESHFYPPNLRAFRYTEGKSIYRGQWAHCQCGHWTFRPTSPIVKIEKYPPILANNSKLPPNILNISDIILIYGEVYNDGHKQ